MARNNEPPTFKFLNPGQIKYSKSIEENRITICIGHAGCGKTFVPALKAVEYLRKERVDKLLVLRAAIQSKIEELGALKGDLKEKYEVYTIAFMNELHKIATRNEIKSWKSLGKIEFSPIEFTRGHTYSDTMIVLDEANCCTYEQLLLVLTRIGPNSKLVLSGDIYQSVLGKTLRGALEKVYNKLGGLDGIGLVELNKSDIVRSDLIGQILERLL